MIHLRVPITYDGRLVAACGFAKLRSDASTEHTFGSTHDVTCPKCLVALDLYLERTPEHLGVWPKKP